MRGYSRLRRAGDLRKIKTLEDALGALDWSRQGTTASRLIFGAGHAHAASVIQQYLLIRLTGVALNRALLRSVAPSPTRVTRPMPREWRRTLETHGFAVAPIRATFAWWGYLLAIFGFGLKRALTRLMQGLRSEHAVTPPPAPYAYFAQMAAANLPHPATDGRSYDIFSWYADWEGRPSGVQRLCHSVPAVPTTAGGLTVASVPSAVPALSGAALVRYAAWIVAATAVTAVQLLRGRWWNAFLFAEAALGAEARLQSPDRLASDYLFHNASWIYRPLWSYEAERHGARILFYFYSTNCETFKQPWGYPPQANHWSQMTWPHYLVWDPPQADFVRRAVGTRGRVDVVGPIWFSSSSNIPVATRPAVAVFDVQPWRNSAYQMLGLAEEYYTPQTVVQFLADVHTSVRMAGATMLLKRKRDAGPVLHPRYVTQVDRLESEPDCQSVDPSVAATRVIECCDVVVSAPFTSTALLARHLGKPSVYYDPFGDVQRDDRGAHGIPIIVGPEELSAWMTACMATIGKGRP